MAADVLFIVRIELHDIGEDHKAYGILHAKMADADFNQQADGKDGIAYVMPRATYRRWDSPTKTTNSICDIAIAVLKATIAECKKTNVHSQLTGSVYVIKGAEDTVFYGLKPVKTK